MALLTIKFSTATFGGSPATVAALTGSADASNVAKIDKQVLEVLSETEVLILDVAELTYANSTFIGHLTDWYSRLVEAGHRIVLIGCQPQVFDTLNVVGLLNIVPHYTTLAEAERALVPIQTEA